MWGWACGGTAAAVGVVLAGGAAGRCGPGRPADGRVVAPPPAPPAGVVVRFDEPPPARRPRPAPAVVQASYAEPAGRYAAPGDPF